MPAELLEPVVYFLAYWTGKPVVRIRSLGRLHVAFLAEPSRREKQKLRWYSVTFMRDGKRYVDAEAVCLVGMIVWAVVIAAVVLISRRLCDAARGGVGELGRSGGGAEHESIFALNSR